MHHECAAGLYRLQVAAEGRVTLGCIKDEMLVSIQSTFTAGTDRSLVLSEQK